MQRRQCLIWNLNLRQNVEETVVFLTKLQMKINIAIYLILNWAERAFKGTAVNREMPSKKGGRVTWNYAYSPFNRTKYFKRWQRFRNFLTIWSWTIVLIIICLLTSVHPTNKKSLERRPPEKTNCGMFKLLKFMKIKLQRIVYNFLELFFKI